MVKAASKLTPAPQVMLRLCRNGWAVIVDKIPNAQGTRLFARFARFRTGFGARARVSQAAPRAMGEAAPGGGIATQEKVKE